VREETGVTADKCRQILDGLAEISKTSCQVILTTMGFPTAVKVENCTKGFEEGKFYLRDEPVVKAKENVEATLGYFENRFNRRSFDGQGTRALSLVHAGSKMNNAGWYTDMALMVYGEGDGVRFNDFTKAVDVAGHEMAHGVVSHSAKLMMMDESGALNEAIADYFGKRVEGGNGWTIGKGLFRDDPEKGLRDLEEPGRLKHRLTPDGSERSYPKRYSERMTTRSACDSSNDRCFVHINSTIMGHVFYRMDRELGSETAEEILYTALTQFWSERTGFKTAGKNLQSVCRMRFGKLSQQCTTLDRILKEAEI
jgi:Zn-dependent metalloprotease